MSEAPRGATIQGEEGPRALVPLLARALEKGTSDAVLLPLRTPGQDSYAFVLVKDPRLLRQADPLPPVQTVTGGRALSSLTRHGGGGVRILAVMRPCEARGAIELSKLGQVDLKDVTLITMDCPGTVPLQRFARGDLRPSAVGFADQDIRPICQVCDLSCAAVGDLHLGWGEGLAPILIPMDERGAEALLAMGLRAESDTSEWRTTVSSRSQERRERREERLGQLRVASSGLDNLMVRLDSCINCHNCMRACPICYCRVCAFDIRRQERSANEVLDLAKARGSMRLPMDTLMFHLGRMNHMSLNCVSCGACEDACPAGVPIAQLFAMVSDRTQSAFKYRAGMDRQQRSPLITFLEKELEGEDGQRC